MLLFAAFLCFGWPKERTEWVPSGTRCPVGLSPAKLATCCGSMRPAIHGGEIAFVEKYTNQTDLVGCIIDNGHSCHRVTAETKDAVLTSGDNNRYSDGWCLKTKIRFIIRKIVRPSL